MLALLSGVVFLSHFSSALPVPVGVNLARLPSTCLLVSFIETYALGSSPFFFPIYFFFFLPL
ncbi:unnamed protein product [Tuber melanosporum]|uniref:(Perigord truffle) hypothetical protein n=1 Tax=Tuber melanosporum (strain Mel28) TaxID=656061 RepID=D5GL52_TUBMM|nr:uncharacterized protein GSTUM_00010009001 [Tuber melanosporum]CAZ85245.1 unnamed protein product [Tuber melanosporum]